ncbi:MAG: hypothetical protein HUU21_13095 [Polyangiaceae bacterium]|nr:hypothetical protein [Polyangiaceae bacterium]
MRPRIPRALVALVLAAAVTTFSGAAAAASEFTFALPEAPSAPFDLPRETHPTTPALILPPFDFPEPEPIASCRGCRLENQFEPPPFTL